MLIIAVAWQNQAGARGFIIMLQGVSSFTHWPPGRSEGDIENKIFNLVLTIGIFNQIS